MYYKSLIFILLALFSTSCDLILKDRNTKKEPSEFITNGGKEIIGESDDHGCTPSAGYRWSDLKEDCIRVFEEGFRLNPIEAGDVFENELEDNDISCFIVFSKDKKQAEVFLPRQLGSFIVKADNSNQVYVGEGWQLVKENLVLSYKGEPKYAAAKTVDMKMIMPNVQEAEEIENDTTN